MVSFPIAPDVKPMRSKAPTSASSSAYVQIVWDVPTDTGDLRDDSIPIVEYLLQFSTSPSFNGPNVATTSLVPVRLP